MAPRLLHGSPGRPARSENVDHVGFSLSKQPSCFAAPQFSSFASANFAAIQQHCGLEACETHGSTRLTLARGGVSSDTAEDG